MATQTSEEVLEQLKKAVKRDIEVRVQMNGHPLADEIKQIEHHLTELETAIKQIK